MNFPHLSSTREQWAQMAAFMGSKSALLWCLAGMVCLPLALWGQAADTTAAAPAGQPTRFWRALWGDYPNPRTAVVLSLVAPGAGQMYNKKWWKVPLAYGALGVLVYSEVVNVRQYRALRDNYRWLVDDDPATNPTEPPYNQLDAVALRRYRDQWRRRVELNAVGIALAYFLITADAFVDAHLARFDVGEDLSGKLRLDLQPVAGGVPAIGLSLSVRGSR